MVTFSVHVMLDEVCGYLLCSCHAGGTVWLPSLFMSCWVKSVVTFSVHVMLGEVCGYLRCFNVMLGEVCVYFYVHVMLGEVCGYLLCFKVMLGEVCGDLLCSCHVG